MKFLLTCMTAMLLAANVELARQVKRQKVNPIEKFKIANIMKELCIPETPFEALQVVFNFNKTVNFGNTLYPYDTNSVTSLGHYSSPDCMYTCVIVDMDAPYPCKRYMSPWLVGMYSNIRNSDINSADIAVEPIAATSPPSSCPGESCNHRIVILLYLQVTKIDITNECFNEYQFARMGFPLEDFTLEYGLTLVAGNYYMALCPNKREEVCAEYCDQYCGVSK